MGLDLLTQIVIHAFIGTLAGILFYESIKFLYQYLRKNKEVKE